MTYQKSILIPMEKYERLVRAQESTIKTEPQTLNNITQIIKDDIHDDYDANQMHVDTILMAIPKNNQHKARALLMHIQTDKCRTLTWNDRGEIIISGESVPGSHISDLIKDAMYRYRNLTPIGHDKFYKTLADMNIPLGLIGNEERRNELLKCRTYDSVPKMFKHEKRVNESKRTITAHKKKPKQWITL